jgi:predicted transcriptional regulator
MPLSSLEFAFALDAETLRDVKAVHAFLKANPKLAFTPEEVAETLGQDAAAVHRILEKLDDLDLAQGGTVNGVLYFIYRADLPVSVR